MVPFPSLALQAGVTPSSKLRHSRRIALLVLPADFLARRVNLVDAVVIRNQRVAVGEPLGVAGTDERDLGGPDGSLAGCIHLDDLARRAELSPYHFARAFKTSAGTTPRAFVEERRIERARHLIHQSHDSLADIAVASGFGTQSRLTTTFKRRTGFTPAEFRRGRPEPAPGERPATAFRRERSS